MRLARPMLIMRDSSQANNRRRWEGGETIKMTIEVRMLHVVSNDKHSLLSGGVQNGMVEMAGVHPRQHLCRE